MTHIINKVNAFILAVFFKDGKKSSNEVVKLKKQKNTLED
jgi:hypothetical protein